MGLFDRFKQILPPMKPKRSASGRASVETDAHEAGPDPRRNLDVPEDNPRAAEREENLRGRKAQFVFPLREEAEIHFKRGNAYFKIENYSRALSDYSRALELYPDHLEARYNRAVTFKATGDYLRAVEDLTWVIEVDPTHVRAYEGRAAVYNTLKDSVSEVEDMKAAARLGSNEMKKLLKSKGLEW